MLGRTLILYLNRSHWGFKAMDVVDEGFVRTGVAFSFLGKERERERERESKRGRDNMRVDDGEIDNNIIVQKACCART